MTLSAIQINLFQFLIWKIIFFLKASIYILQENWFVRYKDAQIIKIHLLMMLIYCNDFTSGLKCIMCLTNQMPPFLTSQW